MVANFQVKTCSCNFDTVKIEEQMTSLKEMLTATRQKGNIIHTYSDWLRLTFDHTIELEGLASRDFECPRAMLIGNLVHRQPAGSTP